MRNLKKFAALALTATFVLSMAACGSKDSGESTNSVSSSGTSASVGGTSASSEEEGITSIEDLAELKIGVQTGTTGDLQATEAVNSDSQMNRFNTGADAVQALKNGKVDCVVIDSQPAAKFVELNDDLEIVEGIFDVEEYAISLKKGNTELKEEINGALNELKADGTIDSIMSNYIGDEAGQHPYESPADVDRSKGTLTMATNAFFEPWEYYEGSEIVGIDADIAQAICDKLGYELKIEDMAFDTILVAGDSGKADFGMAGMTVTPEREESVEFTDTYADASQVVIVKK